MTKLSDLCTIKLNFADADFWIVRRGSIDAVGSPTKTFSPEAIGIKVTATDMLDPRYLFYWFQYISSQGIFKKMATGTLRLVNIRTEDIKNLTVSF